MGFFCSELFFNLDLDLLYRLPVPYCVVKLSKTNKTVKATPKRGDAKKVEMSTLKFRNLYVDCLTVKI